MQIQYGPLASIRLKHDYFPDGNCPTVSLVPTRETDRVMKNLGIRTVERDFGAELFYNIGSQLLATEAPVRLSFMLRPSDPLFLNYTDLSPSMDSSSVRYLTNLSPQPDLPAGAFRVKNGELLPLVPLAFTIGVSPGALITLTDELGNKVHTYTGEEDTEDLSPVIKATTEDGTEIRVNLSEEPAGLYTLWERDEILIQFINAPGNWQTGDVCLISIYLGNTGAFGEHILVGGTVTPTDFHLAFPVRETKWRYYLIDNGNPGFEHFQLIDQASDQAVTESSSSPLTRTLPDGSEAIVLAAPHKVPLRQRPGQQFTLRMKQKGGGGSTPITMPLPSADASRLSKSTPDGADGDFYSDIYVYL